MEDQPRGAGCLLAAVAPARRGRHAGRPLRCRDDALGRHRAHAQPGGRLRQREDPHRHPRRRRPPRHLARRPGQAQARVRRQGQRHRRQQLADVGWLRRPDHRQRSRTQALQPDAAGPLCVLRRAWRAARDHGHRSDRGHPGRAEGRRHQRQGPGLGRTERSLRRPEPGRAERPGQQGHRARPRQGQPQRRRHRTGPPAGRHRRHPRGLGHPRPAPHRRQVRHGDDVRRCRPGCRRHLRKAVSHGPPPRAQDHVGDARGGPARRLHRRAADLHRLAPGAAGGAGPAAGREGRGRQPLEPQPGVAASGPEHRVLDAGLPGAEGRMVPRHPRLGGLRRLQCARRDEPQPGRAHPGRPRARWVAGTEGLGRPPARGDGRLRPIQRYAAASFRLRRADQAAIRAGPSDAPGQPLDPVPRQDSGGLSRRPS
mmetsp:Transcript_61304/g.144821  ORF Transcript_61304/g.144821 Transcript_61304/m.144821 type:complete len:426 (-) Transcript_61304:29-1306(-)